MGEVYRAHDSRLRRDVAIKVSPERFSERFEREARAVAALNHPNICQIYDVGPNYLVMELVEGHAPKGPIELDDALAIAQQIADALQEAHSKHITHRDLRPGNIMVTSDGKVKVLDFGLAKFGNTPTTIGEDSPTISMAMTQAGMILGTAAYMSPEQARGKEVDSRADIWAFGVVFYEILTGQRLFKGEDLADTLASVVKEQPNLDGAPTQVRRLLDACLQKDPKKRLQSIGDWRLLLDAPRAEAPVVVVPPKPNRVWPAIAAVAVLGAAALAFVHFRENPAPATVLHLAVPLPENTPPWFVALSPDGRRVAAVFTRDNWNGIWVRALDGTEWVRLEASKLARTPFWSPDSRFLGFFADGKLKTVPAAGGPATELCGETGLGSGGAWNQTGVILLGGDDGRLRRVPAAGGECAPVFKDSKVRAAFPEFLPDGNHFLYVNQADDFRGVYSASLDNPAGKKVLADYSSVIYAYGTLLFLRGTNLMAQPFDADKLVTLGDPYQVAAQAAVSYSAPQMAVSAAQDTLLYVSNRSDDRQLVWMDRSGKELGKVGSRANQSGPALSPDGGRAVISRRNEGIWQYDLVRNSDARFQAGTRAGVWSPDGSQVAFAATIAGKSGLYRTGSNGGGSPELLLAGDTLNRFASDWSRDGKFLLYTEVDPKTLGDIWYLPDPGKPGGKPVKFLATDAVESQAQLSPDGHWIAYVSNETGQGEV